MKRKIYPKWMRDAARKGGKVKSPAKTAAARKANAVRWGNEKLCKPQGGKNSQ